MDDLQSRKAALTVGQSYRVLQVAPSIPPGTFEVGEKLRLYHVGYSHYDCAYGYTFETSDGTRKSYLLGDEQSLEELFSVFELDAPWH